MPNAPTPQASDLESRLLAELEIANDRLNYARAVHFAQKLARGTGPSGFERKLIESGVPALDADAFAHGDRAPPSRQGALAAVRKLERRIAGLRRWQERRAS